MTTNHYFLKWRKTVNTLKHLLVLDIEYQAQAHDKEWSDAIRRLSSILSRYIACYNEAIICWEQNLQIQKTVYIENITKHIVKRILELKEQIRELEGCYHHFLTNGLTDDKLTTYDVEVAKVPEKTKRPKNIQDLIATCFYKDASEDVDLTVTPDNEINNVSENAWWDENVSAQGGGPQKLNVTAIYQVEEKISVGTLTRKKLISLIQAHEKTRQVARIYAQSKLKRDMWEKELLGTLKTPATIYLRNRSARLIQIFLRTYFEIKRNRFKKYKFDEILGIKLHSPQVNIEIEKLTTVNVISRYQTYKEECEKDYEDYKKNYIKKHKDEAAEDFRDYIRHWFRQWYKETKYFLEIPKKNKGGCVPIINEEVQTPSEWIEQYKALMESKKANKNKSALQKKYEKLAAKKEQLMLRKEEMRKRKEEEIQKRKIMNNPKLHPGYTYPTSKTTEQLQKEVLIYYRDWDKMDQQETKGTQAKCVQELSRDNAYMEAKMEICEQIDGEMRLEYKKLMKALKKDYKNSGEKLPEKIKEKKRRKKKMQKRYKKPDDDFPVTSLKYLADKGFIVQYPPSKFEEFCGESNYAGSDLRCLFQTALPFGYETRAAWWEQCLKLVHGFERMILVGASGSGKTKLVHILASINDAVLYVLDPSQVDDNDLTPVYLEQLMTSVAQCARATQPSVIYIRNVHKLFYSKVPPGEDKTNLDLLKRYYIRILFKRIKKIDNIKIIGSCVDPWLTKSKQLIKKFPSVVLLPDTSYSTVSFTLRHWVLRNRIVPPDLDTNTLAYMLQGYPYGHLIEALNNFLTPARIIRIAACGLKREEIYDSILKNNNMKRVDYQKYLKWYSERTFWGKEEEKKLMERIEQKQLIEKWAEKTEKKKRKLNSNNTK